MGTDTVDAHALVIGGIHGYDSAALRTDSSTSKHLMSWDPDVVDVMFNTIASAFTTSRAVGNVKFKAFGSNADQRIFTPDAAYHVPHQPHNRVHEGQPARQPV